MLSFQNCTNSAAMKCLFRPFLYCVLIYTLFPVSKCSNVDESEPFRMRKVNLLWQKAKRMGLSGETMDELYVELERQDKDERKWKHQKNQGKDELGEMEATLRRNLVNIMDKYGLVGAGDKDTVDTPGETGDHIQTNRVHRGSFVKDERLEKLWHHAVNEGEADFYWLGCRLLLLMSRGGTPCFIPGGYPST